MSLNYPIKLINYDYCRNKILEKFDEIFFGENFSQFPPYNTVNRSPDAHQTAVLQITNALKITKFEDARKYIIRSAESARPKHLITIEIHDKIFRELETEINEINRLLPENEIIKKRFYNFTEESIKLLNPSDIDFLSALINKKIDDEVKKKMGDETRKNLAFIAKWAHRTRIYSSHDLPEGFDVTRYFVHNPDLVVARVNPIKHYILFGRKEGRRYK